MAYYVLKNAPTSKRAEVRLVVEAGSIDERDGEHGLAHMVEHMEFQGTSRYKAEGIVSFMESIGMAFGPEVNAMTGYTDTQYMLSVPTTNPSVVEKAIDILDDWARGPVVDPAQLEKEKGVIAEEARVRLKNAQGRLQTFIRHGHGWFRVCRASAYRKFRRGCGIRRR
jgi:zinc protease